MDGIIVVDKPKGLTSHDVVLRIRRRFNIRKVGHAGTLDPLATGVLIMLLGKCTKYFNQFVAFDKAYKATLILGQRTTTADTEGDTISLKSCEGITKEQVEKVFKKFEGEIQQVPPMVSAIKVNGRKLYELARKGIEIKREPRQVNIKCLNLEEINLPDVRFYVECSKGTYVRQLAEDIGNELGCGACISRIQRTKVGPFLIEDAVKIEDIHENCLRDWKF